MEPLTFLKFRTPTTTTTTINETNLSPNPNLNPTFHEHQQSNDEESEEQEEDSFFELELTVPTNRFETTKHNVNTTKDTTVTTMNTQLIDSHINDQNTLNKVNPLVDFFAKDSKQFLYKRRILPIEPSSRPPQSPISLLKSAPKFRVFFMFRKPKPPSSSSSSSSASSSSSLFCSKTEPRRGHAGSGSNNNTNTGTTQNLFTLKFKIKDVQPIFARVNSSRRKGSEDLLSDDSSSKRFSKDVLHKYLSLVKPFYVKVSKRNSSEKVKVSEGGLVKPLPEVRPEILRRDKDMHGKKADGFKVVCRHLGKSKSSSSAAAAAASGVGVSSPARRDDSLAQQHDGIQSAILHCKRSFNSSRDLSHLSRSVSNPCQEKLIDSARNSNSSNYEGDDRSMRNYS